MKILLAPNSFKECCNSVETVEILSNSFSNSLNFPISDGGDGFLEVSNYHLGLTNLNYKIQGIRGSQLENISVKISHNYASVFISASDIIGLKLIPKKERNPMLYNSAGIGKILRKISMDISGAKNIYIGIGGTATNDLGIGACSEFGLKLKDLNGSELLPLPKYFGEINDIEWQKNEFPFKIVAVADVNNPLLGEMGAVRTYSKQKGASNDDLILLENGFENIINILSKKGLLKQDQFLSGAGGGLAAGLQIFFNAKMESSRNFILKTLGLERINNVQYVVTGEGSFDEQSLMDKAPGIVIDHFKDRCKKIFIICGTADKNIKDKLPKNVEIIELVSFFPSKEESIRNFKSGLKKAAEIINKSIAS